MAETDTQQPQRTVFGFLFEGIEYFIDTSAFSLADSRGLFGLSFGTTDHISYDLDYLSEDNARYSCLLRVLEESDSWNSIPEVLKELDNRKNKIRGLIKSERIRDGARLEEFSKLIGNIEYSQRLVIERLRQKPTPEYVAEASKKFEEFVKEEFVRVGGKQNHLKTDTKLILAALGSSAYGNAGIFSHDSSIRLTFRSAFKYFIGESERAYIALNDRVSVDVTKLEMRDVSTYRTG